MAVYELSVEPVHVREAERVVSLEGREFPTLVMSFESRIHDQSWQSTIVLDYHLTLPPLSPDQPAFIPVRIGAFVGNTPTKYLYFGTEMNENVPRVAPEMENLVSPEGLFQEFLLDESTCPVAYARLVTTTPRIFGNGAQDYYAPPIKIERYDAVVGPNLIADLFPEIVANLSPIPGSYLVDPAQGFWAGARYVGIKKIAILRQGKVVGLLTRPGRLERDQPPPGVHIRDPKLDLRSRWVAIDLGTRTTTIGLRGAKGTAELLRLGTTDPAVVQADFESPSEVAFLNLGRALKAWRERVILPMTRWEDVHVGAGARALRQVETPERAGVAMATIDQLALLPDYHDNKQSFVLAGAEGGGATEKLKRPAPPVIDQEGIGAHDPFDPLELFAYYVGLLVNHRTRGIHLKYRVTMPTGWSPERRAGALVAFRRGVFRSLPAGLCEYHDLETLEVVDAGASAIPFVVHSLRAFSIAPRDEPVIFAVLEAGASEAGLLFGTVRDSGGERIVEHLEPSAIRWFGGERLLHRLAHQVYAASAEAMREANVPFEPAPGEEPPGDPDLLGTHPAARANRILLKDVVRPLLEGDATARVERRAKLVSADGHLVEVELVIERVRLKMALDGWFDQLAAEFAEELKQALTRIARGSDPYEGLRVILGGRVGMHPKLQEAVQKALPSQVRVHRYREPDKTNLHAPTVKTATVLGALALQFDRVKATVRFETRDAFRYRVGRARHGQLIETLDPSVEYDEWRDMGACTKPEIDVLFMVAEDDGEVAADDPRVRVSSCRVGEGAVGLRVFIRALGPQTVEVGVGSDAPDPAVPTWLVNLATGAASPRR